MISPGGEDGRRSEGAGGTLVMEEVIEGGEGQVEKRWQFVKMNLAIRRQNKSLKIKMYL